MRYKLRSSAKSPRHTVEEAAKQAQPPANADEAEETTLVHEGAAAISASDADLCSPPKKPRLPHRRRKKSSHHHKASGEPVASSSGLVAHHVSRCTVQDLPQELILHIGGFLDAASLLALLRTCQWFYNLLKDCNSFWKIICSKEELANYQCLLQEDDAEAGEGGPSFKLQKVRKEQNSFFSYSTYSSSSQAAKKGWRNKPMHVRPSRDLPYWRRVYVRGMKMRQNIWQSNYEGWRMYANTSVPVTKLTPELDLNDVRRIERPLRF